MFFYSIGLEIIFIYMKLKRFVLKSYIMLIVSLHVIKTYGRVEEKLHSVLFPVLFLLPRPGIELQFHP